MKLEARRVAGFLRDPGRARLVLLYGDDVGLVRSRADALTRAVIGGADDPFRLVWLNREETGRLAEEASALSLVGGRRVVRVRNASDALLPALRSAMAASGETLIILEGAELPARSKLRTFVEGLEDGAAIGCYPEEGRTLEDTIRTTLAEDKLTVDGEAMEWLKGQLGADYAETRAELGKLALYAGPGGRIDLAAAEACVGDAAALSIDDALFAASVGDLAGLDRALALALAEGAAPVAMIRAAIMHLQRLHRVRLVVDAGATVTEATKQARPPVFFRRVSAFTASVSLWSSASLLRALDALAAAERQCKRTGAPDSTLAAHVLTQIGRQARALRRGLTPG
jgi:DNA polymerase III subunit delta